MKHDMGPGWTVLALVAVLGVSIAAAAQPPPTDIPVTGCLERTSDGFRLVDATPGPGVLEPGAHGKAEHIGSWRVTSAEDLYLNIAVGHRVEITGHPRSVEAPAQPERRATGDAQSKAPEFVVSSVKHIGKPCD